MGTGVGRGVGLGAGVEVGTTTAGRGVGSGDAVSIGVGDGVAQAASTLTKPSTRAIRRHWRRAGTIREPPCGLVIGIDLRASNTPNRRSEQRSLSEETDLNPIR